MQNKRVFAKFKYKGFICLSNSVEPPNDKEITFPGVSNTQDAKKAGDTCM